LARRRAWLVTTQSTARRETTKVFSLRKTLALVLATAAFVAALAPAALADPGGGPGSNNGCPGHHPPPPPSGGCGD
jgi:hypothetical protein